MLNMHVLGTGSNHLLCGGIGSMCKPIYQCAKFDVFNDIAAAGEYSEGSYTADFCEAYVSLPPLLPLSSSSTKPSTKMADNLAAKVLSLPPIVFHEACSFKMPAYHDAPCPNTSRLSVSRDVFEKNAGWDTQQPGRLFTTWSLSSFPSPAARSCSTCSILTSPASSATIAGWAMVRLRSLKQRNIEGKRTM